MPNPVDEQILDELKEIHLLLDRILVELGGIDNGIYTLNLHQQGGIVAELHEHCNLP